MASLYTDLFDEDGGKEDQSDHQDGGDEYNAPENNKYPDLEDFQHEFGARSGSPGALQDAIPISCWNDAEEEDTTYNTASFYDKADVTGDDDDQHYYEDDYDEEEKSPAVGSEDLEGGGKRELEIGMDLDEYFNISSLLEALPQKEDLFAGCSMDSNEYDGDERSYLLELMQDPEYQNFLQGIKDQETQHAQDEEQEDDEEEDDDPEEEEEYEVSGNEYDNEDYEEEDPAEGEAGEGESELRSSICKQLFTSFQSTSPTRTDKKTSLLYQDIDAEDDEDYYDSFLSLSKKPSDDNYDDAEDVNDSRSASGSGSRLGDIEDDGRADNLKTLNNFLSKETDEEPEEEMKLATQDLQNIMNDYTELLSYMNSPRAEQMVETIHRSFNDGNFTKVEKILNKSFTGEDVPLRDKNRTRATEKIRVKKKVPNRREVDREPETDARDLSKKKGSAIILLPVPVKKPQPNDNGVLNRLRKRGQPKKKTNPAELAALKRKQIEVLAQIAAKKKAEKDEQLIQEEKVLERRKKFKEALLEKALRSREADEAIEKEKEKAKEKEKEEDRPVKQKSRMKQPIAANPPQPPQKEKEPKEGGREIRIKPITGENQPGFLLPTAAFKLQSIIKTTQQVVVDQEEYAREQELKREIVAKMRRKFKEKHNMILEGLAQKKKEQDLKDEQEKAKEEQLRLKRKRRLDQLLSTRDSKIKTDSARVDTDDNSISSVPTPNSSKTSGAAASSSSTHEAGSALAAIRKKQTKDVPMPRVADPEAKEGLKNQRMKLSEYFSNLSEQKKKEEEQKRLNEERQKKRVAILSQRILQEGNERKLMSKEDNSRYNTKPSEPSEEKKSKKFTQEMVDALTQRLQGGVPATSTRRDEIDKERDKEKDKEVKSSGKPRAPKPTKKSEPSDQHYLKETTNSSQSTVVARDFADWKRKNGISPDGKVFCMTGWYPCVKEDLIERGWHYNPDPTSTFFNLKWTLKSLDVCQETLLPWQLTNHYMKNVAITTKAGLIKSLQSLMWLADADIRGVIPRGYDLSIQHDTQSFIDDYRCQHAEGILKKLYYKITGLQDVPYLIRQSDDKCASSSEPEAEAKPEAEGDEMTESSHIFKKFDYEVAPIPPVADGIVLSDIRVNGVIFNSLCNILEKQVHPYTENYLDDKKNRFSPDERTISDLDWEVVSNYSLYERVDSLPPDPPTPVDAFLRNIKEDDNSKLSFSSQQNIQREKKRQAKQLEENRDEASNSIRSLRSLTQDDFQRIHQILSLLYAFHGAQYGLNGNNINASNFWIVKPAAKSRGRGIMTFNDLPKLLKYVDAGSGLSSQWIVQKYMENPLIIAERKFDLRQWVLVTDWNPLTVYFYDECYARFSVEKYSTEQTDLENAYIHLVNNSIGKNSEKFNDIITAENGDTLEGFMWSYESIRKYVEFKSGRDLVTEKIRPMMKEIAKSSLMCASEMIEHRKNSWELYGFDFMIDENYQPWLIEINSSPACDYSTKVTERYIKKALVELLTVVLDVREWDATPKNQRGEKPSTGDWHCIYQGPLIELPNGSFGVDISLKGEGIKAPRFPSQSPNPPLVSRTANPVASTRAPRNKISINSLDRDSRKSFPRAAGNPVKTIRKQKSNSDLPEDKDDFDDSDTDEDNNSTEMDAPSSHIARLRKLSEGKLQTDTSESEKKKKVDKPTSGPVNAVAVPVKVFSVDF